MKEDKDFLADLLSAYSPSGLEQDAIHVWNCYCTNLGLNPYYSDKIGNHAYSLGNGPEKILLSGHIDEVNARVIHIDADGNIAITSTGGMCRKSLIASEVTILGDKGPVKAIIGKKPIHLESLKERGLVEEFEDLRLDVGAESREEVEALGICPGSIVVYKRNVDVDFGPHRIVSNSLDDKLAVYITAIIMKHLQASVSQWGSKYTVIGMAAAQEETGCRGAQIAAHNINPDISIDFDVTFATDGGFGIKKDKHGDIQLGKGGVIQYGPDKSIRIANLFKEVCRKHNILFQTAAGRCGGTNTNQIQLMSANCETMLVSIPNRNMHTPVETCDWRDVQSIIDMTVAIIEDKML